MAAHPDGYIPRLADVQLARLAATFGAVQVHGPKWCGKTWTCRTLANSEIRLDEPGMAELVEADPALALRGAGWAPPFKLRKRLRANPKRYFCDPSLSAAVLGVYPERLLRDGRLFGMLFESLCMRDVRIYADAQPMRMRLKVYYYCDDSGLECDIVLERPDGVWGAVEVKLGENGVKDAERSLLRLRSEALANPQARMTEPRFLIVLVGACPYMGTLPSGVTVLPLVKLGA